MKKRLVALLALLLALTACGRGVERMQIDGVECIVADDGLEVTSISCDWGSATR